MGIPQAQVGRGLERRHPIVRRHLRLLRGVDRPRCDRYGAPRPQSPQHLPLEHRQRGRLSQRSLFASHPRRQELGHQPADVRWLRSFASQCRAHRKDCQAPRRLCAQCRYQPSRHRCPCRCGDEQRDRISRGCRCGGLQLHRESLRRGPRHLSRPCHLRFGERHGLRCLEGRARQGLHLRTVHLDGHRLPGRVGSLAFARPAHGSARLRFVPQATRIFPCCPLVRTACLLHRYVRKT